MRVCRIWTDKEDALLRERYGNVATPYLARILDRTPCAVRRRARLLRLYITSAGEGVCMADLARALGVQPATVRRWVYRDGLPAHVVRIGARNSIIKIRPDVFWRWIEPYAGRIDWTMTAPRALPPEPPWVDVLRRQGAGRGMHQKRGTSVKEIERIRRLRAAGYTAERIAHDIGRTVYSVRYIIRQHLR